MIYFKNHLGHELDISFENDGISIADIQGLGATAVINTSSIGGYDGATFISEQMPMRNISMLLLLYNEADKQVIYNTFKLKKEGTLYYHTESLQAKITCRVERIEIPPNTYPLTAQISLLCPQPYFEALEEIKAQIAKSTPMFRFPFTFPSGTDFTKNGMTTEIGIGIKTIDNPYTITGLGENGTVSLTLNGTTINVPVSSPLYSLNGVNDRICYQNGLWGIWRNFRKKIITGDEAFYKFDDAYGTKRQYVIVFAAAEPTSNNTKSEFFGNYTSNCFTPSSNTNVWNLIKNYTFGMTVVAPLTFNFNNSVTLTIDEVKAIFKSKYDDGNPVVVIYQIMTPTFTPFASDLQTQINNLVGFKISKTTKSVIVEIDNKSDIDVGMTIIFSVKTAVKNPSIMNIDTYETAKLNFDMIADDVITISTYKGKKTITLLRNNVQTNIFNYKESGFKFLQLHSGLNQLKYDAQENSAGLEVTIYYKELFVGV